MRIPDAQWHKIENLIPIACVDVMPWQRLPGGALRLGLIRREDEIGRLRWNLIGGRVRIDETLAEALHRHIVETLGPSFQWSRSDFRSPETVGEYLRTKDDDFGFDLRHHAIALAYTFECMGSVAVGGEAVEFELFAPDSLPQRNEIGFQQASVIYRLAECAARQAAASD